MLLWWEKRKFPGHPLEFLPQHGLVVSDPTGRVVVIGFLYFNTIGPSGVIECVVSDPDYDKIKRQKATDYLFAALIELASTLGCKLVGVSTSIKQMEERFVSLGFTPTDRNVTIFVRRL